MFRFSLTNPRFLAGTQVTDGTNVGIVKHRTFNSLLKRESTDTYKIIWKRTLNGRFIKSNTSTVSGSSLLRYTSVHKR
jgi:hypothetical protein